MKNLKLCSPIENAAWPAPQDRVRQLCKDGKVNLHSGPKVNPNDTEIFEQTFSKIAGFSARTYRTYKKEAADNDNYVHNAEPTRKKRRLELEFPTLSDAVCKLVDEARVGGFLTKAKIHASLTQQFGFSCSERHAVAGEGNQWGVHCIGGEL